MSAKSAGIEIDAAAMCLDGAGKTNDDFAGVMTAESAQQSPRGWLAVVADGVSSALRGRDAAHTAGEGLFADFPSVPVGWDTTVALDRIISANNEWLWRHSENSKLGAMETTLTALVVGSRYFTVAHVGDCRCYLLRGNRLFQLTQDHTRHGDGVVQRGALTRALGLDERVFIDYRQEPVQLDDVFILLSDGVWSVLPDETLRTLVREASDARSAVEALCQTARARGSTDDASAIVLRVIDWAAHDLPVPDESELQLPLPPKLKTGDQLDGLLVEALAGEGEVSRVYRVRDSGTQRLLALKTFARGRGPLAAERTTLAREHWLSAHAPLCVPRAVMPLAAPSAFYYLFEWIEGSTLQSLASKSPRIGLQEWVRLARESLRALAALHRRGIVHRDIKPDNLVQQADGLVRILDLGVAITRRRDDQSSSVPAGTPAYINPEQWNGAAPNEQSDLFALGVTLYHVLTHALPYGEVQPYQSGRYQRDPVPATQLRPDVPRWVDHWLARAYARREVERYETCEEMELTLERAAQSGSLPASEPRPLIERGTTGLLWIGLIFSLLLNVLLIVLRYILPQD
ncbi:MAG TPA: bifunctional protein-serine/threonine kinase/phosphatase [Polyangiales bacterium]|nr:bifunctional protein-serine/threonine kinase/phosphatase [Polyangiales bacterium]